MTTKLVKSATGLAGAVLGICFPTVPGYAFAVVSAYYCINQFSPVAAWIFRDLKRDLNPAEERDG